MAETETYTKQQAAEDLYKALQRHVGEFLPMQKLEEGLFVIEADAEASEFDKFTEFSGIIITAEFL